MRRVISRMPPPAKRFACDVAGVCLYLPWIGAATLVARAVPGSRLVEAIPLHYYVGKPWKIVRNDALDRFGTPLEHRFSRAEIEAMLTRAGLTGVRFGEAMPRWRVIATKT